MSEKNENIETKMKRLRELADWFESDDFSIAHAAGRFEEAAALAKDIQASLKEIENSITIIKQSFEDA